MRNGIATLAGGALVVGAGCTITFPESDGGSDAAVAASSMTVGDQCATLVTHFCERAIGMCGVADTLADCVANQMLTCCTGSRCGAASGSSAATVSACIDAIDSDNDCNAIFNLVYPPACQGVPQ